MDVWLHDAVKSLARAGRGGGQYGRHDSRHHRRWQTRLPGSPP